MTYVAPTSVQDRTFTIRPFRESDYGPVAELFRRHDIEFLGETNYTEEVLRSDHASQVNFDPAESIRVAETQDGSVVAMAIVMTNQPVPVRPNVWLLADRAWADAVVPPLVDWTIEQAESVIPRVPDHARVVYQVGVHHDNEPVARHYRTRGMTTDRGFYSMRIRFGGQEPAAPVVPDGIRIVTFAEYPHVEQFARALKDGFADHRGAVQDAQFDYYVERTRRVTQEARFDPTVWWLALDADDNPAGVCTSFNVGDEFPDTAYVLQLAVLPAYRRRGLALALLLTSFGEHFRRGRDGVSLGVDASSLTNAVALYERAGMSVAARWDAYELELRSGVELTKQ